MQGIEITDAYICLINDTPLHLTNNTKSSSSDVVRKLEVHLYIHTTKSLVRMDTDCHPI